MRRVTEDQYEEVLRSVLAEEAPAVAPADDSERAARGVTGLSKNVWPILRWGTANTGVLAVQAGEITDREQYDAATEFLLGSGAHMAGTLMLSRIDNSSGLDHVMAVIADPRKLLTEYNAAVGDGSAGSAVHVFDPKLAASVEAMGES